MPKKGANIYKRKDGRWEARYAVLENIYGKKKYISVYGSSYREAREKQLGGMKSSIRECSASLTLSQLMREWISGIQNTVKKSTFQKYESVIRRHIETDFIGNVPIKFLTSQMISDFADRKLNETSPLSAKSINDILCVIGLALSYAEDTYSLKKPRLRRIKEPRKEMRVLSVEEQKRLEDCLWQNMNLYKFGILLALYTGMRIGELCALQWEDVQDENIIVNKTLYRIKSGDRTIVEVSEPKTKTSNRIIPIPSFLLPTIEKFRSTGSVIKNSCGKPVEPRLMQMTFKKYISECELPKTNFHALRHTFATRCVEAGFDIKSLSEILGHTDVKTTLNKYVHSSAEQKKRNMELLKPASAI